VRGQITFTVKMTCVFWEGYIWSLLNLSFRFKSYRRWFFMQGESVEREFTHLQGSWQIRAWVCYEKPSLLPIRLKRVKYCSSVVCCLQNFNRNIFSASFIIADQIGCVLISLVWWMLSSFWEYLHSYSVGHNSCGKKN